MLRVLLLSPLPELDPPNGDVMYTLSLLSNPPRGIEYVRYDEALASGDLRERARRGCRLSVELVREAAINRLRRREILFREPFRFFTVKRGAFDLVHCHVFSVRIDGDETLPMVSSYMAGPDWMYRNGEHWSSPRLTWARGADRALAAMMGVEHVSRLRRTVRLIAHTRYMAEWLTANRYMTPDRIDVVPVGVDVPDQNPRHPRPLSRLLFVGHMEIKGGDVALEAFQQIRQNHPHVTLTMAGSEVGPPRDGVSWVGRVAREQLIGELMAAADVLLYPTRSDGLPLTLIEAMATGLPVAASDSMAIPEVVGGGGIISPVNNAQRLAESVRALLTPEIHKRCSEAAWRRARARYSRKVVRDMLGDAYMRALSSSPPRTS